LYLLSFIYVCALLVLLCLTIVLAMCFDSSAFAAVLVWFVPFGLIIDDRFMARRVWAVFGGRVDLPVTLQLYCKEFSLFVALGGGLLEAQLCALG